jgi:putative hydrolase of the HAD superfamily
MVRIEVVSFDMEGTLIDNNFSDLLWEHDVPRLYGLKNDLEFEEAKRYVLLQYDTIGMGRPEWYDVDYWFRRLGLGGSWRDLLENRQDDCRLYPETLQVLERLSGRCPLIISSNTIREFLQVQLRKLPSVFRHVFSAPSDFGTVKDPDFYGRISDIIGVEPGAIIHVGDNVAFDYEAPREAGMIAFHLDRSGDSGRDHVIRTLVDFEEMLIGLEGNNTN